MNKLGDRDTPRAGGLWDTVLIPFDKILLYAGLLKRIGKYLVTVFLILSNSGLYGVENTGASPTEGECLLSAQDLRFLSYSNVFLGISLATQKTLLRTFSGYPLSLNLWAMSSASLGKSTSSLHRRLSLKNWPTGTPLMVCPR